MIARGFGHIFMLTDLLNNGIMGVLPVQELPHVNAGWAQAKTVTGIGVKENGPIVKLLPEHDEGIGYGLVIVLHGGIIPFRSNIDLNAITT
jgi:hypothetical protein